MTEWRVSRTWFLSLQVLLRGLGYRDGSIDESRLSFLQSVPLSSEEEKVLKGIIFHSSVLARSSERRENAHLHLTKLRPSPFPHMTVPCAQENSNIPTPEQASLYMHARSRHDCHISNTSRWIEGCGERDRVRWLAKDCQGAVSSYPTMQKGTHRGCHRNAKWAVYIFRRVGAGGGEKAKLSDYIPHFNINKCC